MKKKNEILFSLVNVKGWEVNIDSLRQVDWEHQTRLHNKVPEDEEEGKNVDTCLSPKYVYIHSLAFLLASNDLKSLQPTTSLSARPKPQHGLQCYVEAWQHAPTSCLKPDMKEYSAMIHG